MTNINIQNMAVERYDMYRCHCKRTRDLDTCRDRCQGGAPGTRSPTALSLSNYKAELESVKHVLFM